MVQSAAALCVGVGSFSDPGDLPGLAHFLEHMVFMGSQKYPSENGFDSFLKRHGGSDNASTDCERTVFQFDVQRRSFKEALDRWAQFFISPLMIRDAIDREVEAVDSEFQLAKPSDSQRKEMLFGSLAKPGHPMGKFGWGNAKTLKHEPKKKKINVCWALALYGGNSETGFDQNTTYSIFSISITLTDLGLQNFYEVNERLDFWLLRYLFFIVYEEIQKIEANEFLYQEQVDPLDYVEDLCENMQLFPREHLLTGDQLLFQYEPQVISDALALLTPDQANLMLLSPEHEGRCPLREAWFGTNYSVEVNSDLGCLWYKKDTAFHIPKAYIRFHLISPVIQKSAKKYHVYPTCRNTSGVLGFSVTVETQATKFNTEEVELKIEEFLSSFGETLSSLSEDAFRTQVTALVKLKQCEDTHLGEEVDRNWAEVVTQQFVFDRLNREIEALKLMSLQELVSWFKEHRGGSGRKLSVHVVGFGAKEQDEQEEENSGGEKREGAGALYREEDLSSASSYGEVSKLTFLPASPKMAGASISEISLV
ncbi:Nardilysin [Liparis tanakae]|uniref:Nardilysin n=1 Tax=Liparis tanakae TaxID=230148 RepID=A0A4Z2FFL5_9TELE|nr:Nardilysin [Liparis tanakae]